MTAEQSNILKERSDKCLHRQLAAPAQRFYQPPFPEFFTGSVARFRDPIRVKRQRVAFEQLTFPDGAFPMFKKSQHSRCGTEPFKLIISPEKKSGRMPAICVSQSSGFVVVFAEEERSVRTIACVLVEEAVYRHQKALRLFQCEWRKRPAPICCALVVQRGLQICH